MTYFYVKEPGTTDIKKKADTFLCISKEQMDRLHATIPGLACFIVEA